ncbi:MAG: Uncharacterised protein [Opitutia bacterium UBA7350]|nr:MAG: Uncharacterised protein [Opitutae bacterium UBA7350]
MGWYAYSFRYPMKLKSLLMLPLLFLLNLSVFAYEPGSEVEMNALNITINDTSQAYHSLLQAPYRFFDSGGESSNYSNNENQYITFDAGSGNFVWINIKNFNTENSYDRLNILASNTTSASDFIALSNVTAPELIQHLPTSYITGPSNDDVWLDRWYRINTQYVRFNFTSDSSITKYGWDIYLTAVPEPSSYALLLGGLALGLVALRRR